MLELALTIIRLPVRAILVIGLLPINHLDEFTRAQEARSIKILFLIELRSNRNAIHTINALYCRS